MSAIAEGLRPVTPSADPGIQWPAGTPPAGAGRAAVPELTRVALFGAEDRSRLPDLVRLAGTHPFAEFVFRVPEDLQSGPSLRTYRHVLRALIELPLNVNVSVGFADVGLQRLFDGEAAMMELADLCASRDGRIFLSSSRRFRIAQDRVAHLVSGRPYWNLVFDAEAMRVVAPPPEENRGRYGSLFGRAGPYAPWPAPAAMLHPGYGGGLTPENLPKQLPLIAAAASGPYWIAIDRRLHKHDDVLCGVRGFSTHQADRCLRIAAGYASMPANDEEALRAVD
jgi:hypothetical protein